MVYVPSGLVKVLIGDLRKLTLGAKGNITARTTPVWSIPKKCPISCVATVCKSCVDPLPVPFVVYWTLGLNRMSDFMIWPSKPAVPPWPSPLPRLTLVVMVTARVEESLLKSASMHTKHTRFMLAGEELSDETELSDPRVTGRFAFGAETHVLNAASIMLAAELPP